MAPSGARPGGAGVPGIRGPRAFRQDEERRSVSYLLDTSPSGGGLLATDAVRLAEQATGGPALWFLWRAGSGQDSLQVPADLIARVDPLSVSLPGQSIEREARLFEEVIERWRGTQ